MNKVWVYDLEVLVNFFSGTFLNPITNEVKVFVIHKSRDDRKELLEFLNNKELVKGLIGFNNLNYDYPILHFLLLYKNIDKTLVEKLVKDIYSKSQDIIDSKGHSDIKKPFIKQLDLYKLNHYDGAQKRCSLKHLEFSFRWHNLQDMPFKHTDNIESEQDVLDILAYNLNDVLFTSHFYKQCNGKIQQRLDMKSLYNIDFSNLSDTSIGTNIIAKLYSEKTGINFYDFKHKRDERESICLGDLVWDQISFKSKELNDLLYHIKNTTINLKTNRVISTTYKPIYNYTGDDKMKFKIPIKYQNTTYDVLLGGLHSTLAPMIIEETLSQLLDDEDFGSFYPGLMLMLEIFPPHLGKELLEILRELTNMRLLAKASHNDLLSNALKLTINSIFGNLGNEYSFLYSPASKVKVTINGQLILLMLIERLTDLPGVECFYANTDGASFKVDRNVIDAYRQVCKDFSSWVDIPLESASFKKCILRDVNNFLIITNHLDKKGNTKIKVKGDFERTEDGKEWHKNHSMNIVSQALYEYYVHNTPVENYIKSHTDIYDYLKMAKSIGQNTLELWHYNQYGQTVIEPLQKINRYYMSSTSNRILMKKMPPVAKLTHTEKHKQKVNANQMDIFDIVEDVKVEVEREGNVEAGYKVTIFNKFEHKDNITDYNIDYSYYINECYKIINVIK